jgi:hypothetical protein
VILRISFAILFTIALPLIGWGQGIVVIGLPHSEDQKTNTHPSGRTKAEPLKIPFWDDFSQTKTTFANPDLWLYGQSIRVNDGMAIRPPSLKVATFDGVDSLGKPYNVNDVLAKGYADKLVSQSIDLSAIPEDERDSVYLSYRYQLKGNGETPDEGDRLLVSLFDKNNEWVPMDTIENDGSFDIDKFYTSKIHITDARFYHEEFKFMIKNFARLSGPYDTWHIDYIYLNKGKYAENLNIPDRTISEPLTSLLGVYRSIPIKHFFSDGGVSATHPSLVITNQRDTLDHLNDGTVVEHAQPITIFAQAFVTYRDNGTINDYTVKLDSAETGTEAKKYHFTPFKLEKIPNILDVSTNADSVNVELQVLINSGDNIVRTPTKGDYIPSVYAPIDFRDNDTTRASFLLQNKYAYDDGIGEYGAGLNQPGAQIAYKYTMVGVKQENITFLEMYFPRFGDESSQVIELRIWKDLTKEPVHAEVASLQRSEGNKFWLKEIKPAVSVDSVFYIGWKQNSAAVIATGLDKSNDTGDRMYYNTNGEWIQNTTVHGSLMLRPIFGKGLGEDPNGLEDQTTLTVYPNPSSGTFNFTGVAESISVYDMTGRSISFLSESTTNETIVTLPNASHGIYIIKAHVKGAVRTAKVMVR